jgi:branched-chain amino acid transport system substrate-binding protein
LCQAITQAGSPDRQKVRDALASIKEFKGVTGDMKFQGTGDPIKSAVILQIKNGKFNYFAEVQP